MSRSRIVYVLTALTFAVGGCGPTADSGRWAARFNGPSGLRYWSEFDERDQPGTLSRGWVCFWGTEFVVWCDQWESGAAMSGGASGPRVQVQVAFADGRSLELKCDLSAGKSGEVRAGPDKFDLADGTLFLVTGPSHRPRVKQLKRDLRALDLNDNTDSKRLKAFVNADAEMTAFFGRK